MDDRGQMIEDEGWSGRFNMNDGRLMMEDGLWMTEDR